MSVNLAVVNGFGPMFDYEGDEEQRKLSEVGRFKLLKAKAGIQTRDPQVWKYTLPDLTGFNCGECEVPLSGEGVVYEYRDIGRFSHGVSLSCGACLEEVKSFYEDDWGPVIEVLGEG